jgi:hypothetical protein
LPTSGGNVLDGNVWRRTTDDGYILLGGGSNNEGGAILLLNGKARSDEEGIAQLYSVTDSESSSVTLYPNGKMVIVPDVINAPLVNHDISGSAIVSKSLASDGYVKRASGEIIQWCGGQIAPGATEGSVTFPISFTTTARVSVTTISGASINVAVKNNSVTLSGLTAQSSTTSSGYIYFHVIAVGY